MRRPNNSGSIIKLKERKGLFEKKYIHSVYVVGYSESEINKKIFVLYIKS